MKLPQALVNLKASSGANWKTCKKYFVDFLDLKREIQNSNLPPKLKKYSEKLVYRDFLAKDFFLEKFLYRQSAMTKHEVITHAQNVLASLHKMNYDSYVMCYIQDGFNTSIKSGNKKYPQFN